MICPRCQASQPNEARYCMQCGHTLGDPYLLPLAASQGERRQATILFADLVGFTALAEQGDPEDVQRLLNGCFDRLAPVIDHYGGVIDKFIGDEVMVLFGAPRAHEDDPLRAVRAALGLFDALESYNRDYGLELGLHVGINTGLVVAGGLGSEGRRQYTVIGDTVNVAARLIALAGRGEILVGEDTYRATAPHCDYEILAPVQVRNRREPVQAYKLRGYKARPERLRGLRGLSSPMVGRDMELAALERLGAESGLRTVVIAGEAGLGKSRLLAEWSERLAGPRWVQAQCVAYGSSQVYQLALQLAQGLAGITALASQREARTLLRRLARASANPAATSMYLGHLLALPLDAEAQRRLAATDPLTIQAGYVAALAAAIRAQARPQGLVLMLEDVHWADPASVDLLARLWDLVGDVDLIVAATTRPEAEQAGRALLATLPGPSLRLALQPLDPEASHHLVAHLLTEEALPTALRARILQHSEGNPFFVEELIRMLIDQGVLVREGPSWRATGDLDQIALPDQLQGLLAARIDELPALMRHLLRIAAVIGREFALPVLAHVVGTLGVTLPEDYLAELGATGLVYASGTDHDTWMFHHALVQQAAYEALLRDERRRLHGATAAALIALYPERRAELAATIARHLGLADDPDAREFWLLAGDVAFDRYALAEAVAAYRAALALGDDAPQPFDWRRYGLRLGRALELSSREPEAIACYAALQDRARASGDLGLLGAALAEHAKLLSLPLALHDAPAAAALIAEALPAAEALADPALTARLLWIRLLHAWYSQDAAAAKTHGEAAVALCRAHGLREQLAYALHDIERVYRHERDVAAADAARDEAIALWRELGNIPMLADALATASDAATSDGIPRQALTFANEALALATQVGSGWTQAFAHCMLGEAYDMLNQADQAIAHLNQARAISARSGPVIVHTRAIVNLFGIYRILGSRAHIDALSAEIPATVPQDDFFAALLPIIAIQSLAWIAFDQGDLATMRDLIEEAGSLSQAIERQLVPIEADLLRLRFALARAEGRFDAARTILATLQASIGQNRSRRLEALIEEMRALTELDAGQPAQALARITKARQVAEEIGTSYFVWRLAEQERSVATMLDDAQAIAASTQAAQTALETLLAHVRDPALRTSFLALPMVKATLARTAS